MRKSQKRKLTFLKKILDIDYNVLYNYLKFIFQKAMKRNSTFGFIFRELPVGVRQQWRGLELALELPPEVVVGADVGCTLQRTDIRFRPVFNEVHSFCGMNQSGNA